MQCSPDMGQIRHRQPASQRTPIDKCIQCADLAAQDRVQYPVAVHQQRGVGDSQRRTGNQHIFQPVWVVPQVGQAVGLGDGVSFTVPSG